MAIHIVQPNQSAASIARMYTGNPAREKELVRYNQHKPIVLTKSGNLYFKSLHVNEALHIPPSWTRKKAVSNPGAKTTSGAVAVTRLNGLVRSHNGLGSVVGVGQDGTDGGDSGNGTTDDGSGSDNLNQNQDSGGGNATGGTQASTGYTCPAGQIPDGSGGCYTPSAQQPCPPGMHQDVNGNCVSAGGQNVVPSPQPPVPPPQPIVAPSGTNWMLWGGIALGVAVVGGGVYYFSKKGHGGHAGKSLPPAGEW